MKRTSSFHHKEMENMRVLSMCLTAALLLTALSATAAGPDGPYIQARIEFSGAAEHDRFMGIEGLDIMRSKPGVGVTIVTDLEQIEDLRSMGYEVIVEQEDMESFYSSRIRGDNFGDFHTYSETVDYMNALYGSYSNIMSNPIVIATTEEGRPIHAFKISDNPEVDEPEPEVRIPENGEHCVCHL